MNDMGMPRITTSAVRVHVWSHINEELKGLCFFFKKLIVRKFFIAYETDWLVSLVQHFKTDEPGFRGGLIVVDQYL